MDLVTFGAGGIEVEVLPDLGARLHRLRVFGHDLLRTPDDPAVHAREPVFWGSFVMAPWCNRVEAGTPTDVFGRTVDLLPNFADGSAIHGQVFTRPWERDGGDSFAIRGDGDGWPWEYEVRQRIGIDTATLRLDHALVNRSTDPMPGGLGIHPWFMRPLRLAIHARQVYPMNAAMEREPVGVRGPFDLRELRDVPDDLDACWTAVDDPAVELEWPGIGLRATMRAQVHVGFGASMRPSAPSLHVVMASPSTLDAVGVEPQTQAPHGLRRLLDDGPGAMTMLEPGETLSLAVELSFERTPMDPS